MKKNYLLLIIIFGLLTLALYSTYAVFNSEINTLNTDTSLTYTFKTNSNQIFNIGANSKLRFNATVENDMSDTISYGIYYKIVYPDNVSNDVLIAEVTDSDTNTTYGVIDNANNKTVPLIIINNSDNQISVEIGLRTGYYNEVNDYKNIIYNDEEQLITNKIDTISARSYNCNPLGGDDCTEECYTINEDGKNNTYCTVVCINLTESSVIPNLDNSGANTPNLANNMIPVMYYNNTLVKADTKEDNATYKWYDYDNKQWANAVLVSSTNRNNYVTAKAGTVINEEDILAYFVWIPRYKYKVWNINKEVGVDSYDAQNVGIDIVFERGTETTGTIRCNNYSFDAPNSTTPNETCSGANGEYYTHPAFTFGDKELDGIWIGKFDTSSSNPEANYGGDSSTTLTVRIKPNLNPWRNNSVSNFFTVIKNMQSENNIYGLTTNSNLVDTHMLKNMEWGAMAYFTHSKYGRCTNNTCSEIGINNYTSGSLTSRQLKTGCGALASSSESSTCNEYNTTEGQNASTTANLYGIYDTSGGAWEYVMGNMSDTTGSYVYKPSGAGSNFTYNNQTAKYVDTYANGITEVNQVAYNRARLGDATAEVVRFTGGTGGWYDDYAYFTLLTSSWFLRGGGYYNEENAGVFYFVSRDGSSYGDRSTRVGLIVY